MEAQRDVNYDRTVAHLDAMAQSVKDRATKAKIMQKITEWHERQKKEYNLDDRDNVFNLAVAICGALNIVDRGTLQAVKLEIMEYVEKCDPEISVNLNDLTTLEKLADRIVENVPGVVV